jgi:hypothetical protein
MTDNTTKNRVTVSFDVEIPADGCQPKDIVEWLRFGFGDNGSLSKNNPLYSYEPEPALDSFKVKSSNGCLLT